MPESSFPGIHCEGYYILPFPLVISLFPGSPIVFVAGKHSKGKRKILEQCYWSDGGEVRPPYPLLTFTGNSQSRMW